MPSNGPGNYARDKRIMITRASARTASKRKEARRDSLSSVGTFARDRNIRRHTGISLHRVLNNSVLAAR